MPVISGQHWSPQIRAEVKRRLVAGEIPTHIAKAMGIGRMSVYREAREFNAAPPPVKDQFSTYEAIHGPREKPRIRVKAISQERSDAPIFRVLAVGDHHDKPGRDKTRALWIGRHAAETRPDAIVSIGDWASLDSLSSHETPGSQADADRFPFHDDIESLDESLSVFHAGLPVGSIPIFHTHGNHEHRAWRAANRQPKLNGDMPIRLDEVFARYRWQVSPFGEFLNLFGVNFVHVPLSVMGREMGGENVERNVANKTLGSIVFGHTHRGNVHTAMKVGQNRAVTIINLGTSMPFNVIEKYTGTAPSGWTYGIWELRIQAGRIIGWKFFDMLELESTYS